MAELGAKATELSPPQGAGATPVAPVNTSINFSGINDLISIFSKKEDVLDPAISDYAKKLDRLNQAIETGAKGRDTAYNEALAEHSRIGAMNPKLIPELEKVRSYYFGGTQLSEAEQEVKRVKEQRKADIAAASAAGFSIPKGATPLEEDLIVEQNKTLVRNQTAFNNFVKRQEYIRGTTLFNQGQADRELKEMNDKLAGETAGAFLDGFSAFLTPLERGVAANPSSYQDAQMQLTAHHTRVKAEISTLAVTNPTLANLYGGLFNDLVQLGMKKLDPNLRSENDRKLIEDELAITKARIQKLALKSPRVQRGYATNALIGQNGVGQLLSNEAAADITVLFSLEGDDTTKPPLLGTSEVEKDVLAASKASFNGVLTGKFVAHKEQSEKEAIAIGNNVLKDIANVLKTERKLPVGSWKAALDWASDPIIGTAAEKGMLEPSARMAADQVFKISLQQPIVEQLGSKLSATVDPSYFGERHVPSRGSATPAVKKEVAYISMIQDISFDGASLSFKLDPSFNTTEAGKADFNQRFAEAREVISKLVRASAHMEGHKNYKETWEQLRPTLFPSLYRSPKPLTVGEKVTAGGVIYEYLGGPDARESSWKRTTK